MHRRHEYVLLLSWSSPTTLAGRFYLCKYIHRLQLVELKCVYQCLQLSGLRSMQFEFEQRGLEFKSPSIHSELVSD